MKLTTDEVAGIAEYARIALDEQELEAMCTYMNDALKMLEPIREYDLAGVEPTFHPIGDLTNVMAQDEVDTTTRALTLTDALTNAASSVERSFRVPSILGESEGDRS